MALPCQIDPEQWLDPPETGARRGRPAKDSEEEPRRARQLRAMLNCTFKCPIRQECLKSELRFPRDDQWHVYGGYLAGERDAILRPERENPPGPCAKPRSSKPELLAQFMAGASIPDLMRRFGHTEQYVYDVLWYALRSRRAGEDAELLRPKGAKTFQPVAAA